jgi:tRNA threonylcarbamoyladenosine modification (KEOPS) complex Cgi121 subunit
VKIENVSSFFSKANTPELSKIETQFLDASLVATWQHLYFAVLNALIAFRNRSNISNSVSMEIMLYASSQRQIRKAMEMMGLKSETSAIALVMVGTEPREVRSALAIVSKRLKTRSDDKVLELTDRKMALIQKAFEISDLELETVMKNGDLRQALTDLVIERMALLSTQR